MTIEIIKQIFTPDGRAVINLSEAIMILKQLTNQGLVNKVEAMLIEKSIDALAYAPKEYRDLWIETITREEK